MDSSSSTNFSVSDYKGFVSTKFKNIKYLYSHWNSKNTLSKTSNFIVT